MLNEQYFDSRAGEGRDSTGQNYDKKLYERSNQLLEQLGPYHQVDMGDYSASPPAEAKEEYLAELDHPQNREVLKQAFRSGHEATLILSNLINMTKIFISDELNDMGTPETIVSLRIVRYATELIAELLASGDLEKSAQKYFPDWKLLEACDALANKSTYLVHQYQGVLALAKHLPEIRARLEHPPKERDSYSDFGYVQTIITRCKEDEEPRRDAINAMIGSAQARFEADSPESTNYERQMYYFFSDPPVKELNELGEALLAPFLEKYHLPASLTDDWKNADYGYFEGRMNTRIFGDIIMSNIAAIKKLEVEEPGICKFLLDEYGIANFGRYPTEMLLAQYRNRDDAAHAYGVIIYPKVDWNGSFYGEAQAFEHLFNSVADEFSLRVVECGSKIDIARALITFDKKYNRPDGTGHKISLAIIGGHGTKNGIQFGGDRPVDNLAVEDLAGKGVQRAANFFEDFPTIILASCSTGARDAIGQKLSRQFNAKLLAPTEPSSPDGYYGKRRSDGTFRFNARYRKGVDAEYHRGVPRQRRRQDGRDVAAA